jgi:hypothetical protein
MHKEFGWITLGLPYSQERREAQDIKRQLPRSLREAIQSDGCSLYYIKGKETTIWLKNQSGIAWTKDH